MNKHQINLYKSLPEDIAESMKHGLDAYDKAHGIDVNYETFSLVLSNDGGNLIGVLNAYTAFSEIYVDDLWVDEKYRDKGHGRQLLNNLEERFKGKGFNNINLVTSVFQAPEFYQKCGFTLEFIRENKVNPKLTKYFFIKYFDDANQHQGML